MTSRGRDKFSHLERMRREIDDLFDDVWARAGFPHRRAGFRPRVDVYYANEPPRAVVIAELPGVNMESLQLEVRGRTLILAGERSERDAQGRVYQQVEIDHGPFVREIPLNADVEAEDARATYDGGMLRIELPLAEQARRSVPITGRRRGDEK